MAVAQYFDSSEEHAVNSATVLETGITRDRDAADRAHSILNDRFGFNEFRPGQEPVVSRLLAGRSALAVFPTGAGKSLCYQLPALAFDGLTVVISPLIALMKDQLDFLTKRGVAAARLDSSLTREETLAVYDGLHSGRLKLLYISPERLGNERFLRTLRRLRIDLLAVDEAHCISAWGHNFRPDYMKLPRLARDLKVGRVLALTATATPAVSADIAREFGIAEGDVVHTGFYRPNLRLHVTQCLDDIRNELLLERLRERPAGPTIVYVTLQRTAEEVAAFLRGQGVDANAYHAGMDSDARTSVHDAFMASDRAVIVATIAFGMGVDKSNIRYVYHYNLPKGLESYAQEIGRAGRDSGASICEVFACADDAVVLENFSYGDTPDRTAIDSFIQEVLDLGDPFDVAIYELSNRHDIRPLVVKTLLMYLELAGIIQSTGPFYSSLKFQPTKPSKEILAQFDAHRADLLRRILRHARKGKTWFTLDVDRVSERIHEPRDRVMTALSYLEETGDLILQAAGVRLGYRLLNRPEDTAALCGDLEARFQQRESNDIDRVRRVMAFADHAGCRTQYLWEYFGEKRGPCGHCCHCEGIAHRRVPPPARSQIDRFPYQQLRKLQDEAPGALDTPRQQTRFLCGLSSPATTRAKLKHHSLFGLFESIPFHEVLALAEKEDQ
jgi:ATP-dependent DNA helicase RecQ